jgi:hydrogenase-4 component B
VSEWLIIAAFVLAGASGVPGLFRPRDGRAGERLFVGGMTLSAACGVVGSILSLLVDGGGELSAPWAVPGGRFAVAVDPISAIFVVQIALLTGLGAWYGLEYWPQRTHPFDGRKVRAFYGAVTAGMLLLVVARNALLFLVGWEIMAAAAFILVSAEDEKPVVRDVGYVYLLSTRGSTLCLFAMFALLAATSGSLDFDAWGASLDSPAADAIFVLAIAGFGLKAGMMPLHIWLPGAHANAPSHVSAMMSGVLIKTGIYGLVRITSLCEQPPLWWGYTLVALGVASGVLGVAFAIAQHDLKRLLAYHSVENIGIIVLGLGIAVLGRSMGDGQLVALGLAGAFLHTWNHGLFKGLLFLSAGSVVHATATREIDRLGGLLRRMPRTGFAFVVGAVAICGLPPLNGLVSELFVYLGLFRVAAGGGGPWLAGALAVPALAFVGALAVACFVKVFGAVFLGQGRSSDVERAQESGPAMLVPMAVLGALCLAIGVGAPLVAHLLEPAIGTWSGGIAAAELGHVAPLAWISLTSVAVAGGVVAVWWWMRGRSRGPRAVGTWDCGYARPSPRMQYTSSSFAQMIVRFLSGALRPGMHSPAIRGSFPRPASFRSHVPDAVLDRLVRPTFSLAGRQFARLRPIQRGNTHLYLLYILGALLALLLWT